MKKEWLSALKPYLQGTKKDEYIPSISGYKDRVLDWEYKEKNKIRLKLKAERLKLKVVKSDLCEKRF
ncbi:MULTISPECIES: hypothetical protein [Pedobacter]|uniref:Uncharacterized protein n=1 Tax=Pedobacter zeae TaxID=1737356 RepID=A0A7W6KHF4_9SPHI|nr:hypothetical protein [Pedobacter zeae]MBB4110582.1 hypothetical protein [Pedobacter zeae]GGH18742.1 hypothetical protein GCM10007422_43130 [Pedobacter zeae]